MSLDDYEKIAKHTSPVLPRPTRGDRRDVLWAYAEWIEERAGVYLWRLEEQLKDIQRLRRSAEINHGRWIASYEGHRRLKAVLAETEEAIRKVSDATSPE